MRLDWDCLCSKNILEFIRKKQEICDETMIGLLKYL
jgi:hypothetical protein